MAARRPAAIGMKPHTGWAAVVALAGPPAAAEVVAKLRLDLAFTFDEGAVYHKGRERSLPEAEALVRAAEERFGRLAREALAALAADLRAAGCEPVSAVVAGGSARPLPPLASILKSHPLVHAAEADLYRRVLLRASEAIGLPARLLPAAEVAPLAARALGIGPAALAARLAALGKASGRPWARDHKEAAMGAWIGLAGR
jgi:hypothetical protein